MRNKLAGYRLTPTPKIGIPITYNICYGSIYRIDQLEGDILSISFYYRSVVSSHSDILTQPNDCVT